MMMEWSMQISKWSTKTKTDYQMNGMILTTIMALE